LFRRPNLPITYRVRLGRRFDPPTDVTSFMTALEREYTQQLTGALQSEWLGGEDPAAPLGGAAYSQSSSQSSSGR
jgi:hypothetical protein